MINWSQLGEDFQQKYESTFCRYESPIDKKEHIFQITAVEINDEGPSELVLHNKTLGELFLKYDGETKLDFTFPEIGYFQQGKRAYRFTKSSTRQWKKGICDATAKVNFPYSNLFGRFVPLLNQETLVYAFAPREIRSITEAIKLIKEGQFSVVLNANMALGYGGSKGEYWLWYDDEPIAEVLEDRVRVRVLPFVQEIKDFMRDTKDYARSVI